MRRSTRFAAASGLLALASQASAQVNTVCPVDGVCFKLNIPESTSSSGNGDIFFQISAPSSYEWVALGQGSRMSGSNIFVVYTSDGGNNVTISPRLATGYTQPSFNSDAQVTLLEGSGVSGGNMIANVRCSNCNSWSGGSADFQGNNGNWIYAFHTSGGPKNSNSQSASISQHDRESTFRWDYANAKGGNSVNPLLNAPAAGTGSGSPTQTSCIPRPAQSTGSGSGYSSGSGSATSSIFDDDDDDDRRGRPTGFPTQWQSGWPTAKPTGAPWGPPGEEEHDDDDQNNKRSEKRQQLPYCEDNTNSNFTPLGLTSGTSNQTKMLIAHGTLAALAFVILFPAGAIAIRLASFPGIAWIHGAFQIFAYLVYTAAFGLGVYIANSLELLDSYHPIIGIVVFVILFFQPIFGFLHHLLYKKYQSRTAWSYVHLWMGRIAITLGIVNGGLGFKLADTMGMGSRSGMIAYSVVAGFMWLAWVAASVIGERRRSRERTDSPPKYTPGSPTETSQASNIPPPNGHYAPK